MKHEKSKNDAMRHELDHIDAKILNLLRENARMPLKEIAEHVFLSSPAVSARIERLEKEGYITGYQVKLNPALLGYPIKAFINLEVEPVQKKEFYPYIEKVHNVVECNCVTGDYSMLIEGLFVSTIELDQFIGETDADADRVLDLRGAPPGDRTRGRRIGTGPLRRLCVPKKMLCRRMLLCYSDRIHRAFCALFGAVLQTKRFEGGLTLLWKKKKLFPKILSSLRLTKIWQRAFTTMYAHDSRRSQTAIFISDMQNPSC